MNAVEAGAVHATAASASPAPEQSRMVALDALRGVAILLVIVHHVGLRFPDVPRGYLGEFLVGIGWSGVDLFYAISGYLITSILLRAEGTGALRSFFVKRFFRIVPLYLCALVAFLGVSSAVGYEWSVIGRLWIDLLFLTAWVIPFLGEHGVPYIITWSVSVEEFAYVLFGAISAFGAGRLRSALGWIVPSALLLRAASVLCFAIEPITLYYFAPGRIDAIAMGGIAAAFPIVRRLSVAPWIPWLCFFATVGLLSLPGRGDIRVATFGYTAIAAISAWLVSSIALSPERKPSRATRAMASLGLVSYFVYLFHEFVVAGLRLVMPAAWFGHFGLWPLVAAAALLTYLPARLSWHWFEYPLIKRGRRIAARCSRPDPARTA